MKERPILFSGPMVKAILDGRKTQTRRVVKHKNDWYMEGGMSWPEFESYVYAEDGIKVPCPYGQPGDRLWVRETWAPLAVSSKGAYYRADIEEPKSGAWKPSIHMPRWASRITLEITGIRVERLQEIGRDDAFAEGLSAITKDGKLIKYGITDRDGLPGNDDYGWHWSKFEVDARLAYRKLWESINGPGSWDANPLVWVVEFRRVV